MAEQKPGVASGSLGRLVRDKVPDVRADAAGALGDVLMHGGKEAIAALKSVSKDPDPATRKRAAGALDEPACLPVDSGLECCTAHRHRGKRALAGRHSWPRTASTR